MQQKLITFAVPCYNSAAYMRHCIETLLSAGEQAEIILVDDPLLLCFPAFLRHQKQSSVFCKIVTGRQGQ